MTQRRIRVFFEFFRSPPIASYHSAQLYIFNLSSFFYIFVFKWNIHTTLITKKKKNEILSITCINDQCRIGCAVETISCFSTMHFDCPIFSLATEITKYKKNIYMKMNPHRMYM